MTKTTSLLGILITIIAGIFLYMKLCSSCGVPTAVEEPVNEASAPVAPEKTSYPFAFGDGEYAYNESDNYNFNVSSSSILMPLAQQVTDGIASLKDFLSGNDGKVINVTGYYKSDETNDSAFPDLGLARANAVKNHLVENGVSSGRINTMSELMDEMVSADNIFYGPVAYSLGDKSANAADELQALFDKINADPLVLYFDSAEASIELNAAQRQKMADISRYLDKKDGAMAEVVGHTDNDGRTSTNMRLGQDRADFARDYLIRNGIASAKINTSSKGESQPIESNATPEGMAKNRRTVVSVKQ